ncbi:hypothetical protein BKA93DRAFT_744107, partial [Sparassis latifolia]
TPYDLLAYNITVVNEDVTTFFGDPDLPASAVDLVPLDVEMPPGRSIKSKRLFFCYLKDLLRFPHGAPSGSAVNDFTLTLLNLLGYDEPDRVLHQ